MPKLVRWLIKTSLVYLALALVLGIAYSLGSLSQLPPLPGLFPVYIHLLVLGWVSQLIFGVAVWMFPKFSQQQPRGLEPLLWACYLLLNLGLLLRVLAEPLSALYPRSAWGWALVISALLQFLAGVLFVGSVWPRVKER